jgi:hypothetical protein
MIDGSAVLETRWDDQWIGGSTGLWARSSNTPTLAARLAGAEGHLEIFNLASGIAFAAAVANGERVHRDVDLFVGSAP